MRSFLDYIKCSFLMLILLFESYCECQGYLELKKLDGTFQIFYNVSTCQNIPEDLIGTSELAATDQSVGSVRTGMCILLFKEENCNGEYYKASAGYHSILDHSITVSQYLGFFENKIKSFKSCTNTTSEMEYHTKFYRSSYFTDIVKDITLHPGCNTDLFLNKEINTIESEACVRLFTDVDCSGNSFKIEAGRHTALSHPILPLPSNSVKSLRDCNEDPKDYLAGPSYVYSLPYPLKFEVAFSERFSDELFLYERISTTCQNIHQNYIKKSNFMQNRKCISLYEKENCEGVPFKVQPGYYPDLWEFNGKLVSFKACTSKYDNEIEHHVKFYSNNNYTGLIDDIDIYPGCNKADLKAIFYSISTPICLELYSDEFCSNGQGDKVQAGNHSVVLPNIIKSLRPCNLEDADSNEKLFWSDQLLRVVLMERVPVGGIQIA